MIGLLCICFALACAACGPLVMRRIWRRESVRYGRYLLARKLLAKGYAPETQIREAQRIERAKKRGKRVVRTWRKVEFR